MEHKTTGGMEKVKTQIKLDCFLHCVKPLLGLFLCPKEIIWEKRRAEDPQIKLNSGLSSMKEIQCPMRKDWINIS